MPDPVDQSTAEPPGPDLNPETGGSTPVVDRRALAERVLALLKEELRLEQERCEPLGRFRSGR